MEARSSSQTQLSLGRKMHACNHYAMQAYWKVAENYLEWSPVCRVPLSVVNSIFTSPKNFIRLFFIIKYKASTLDIVWPSRLKAKTALVSNIFLLSTGRQAIPCAHGIQQRH